MHPYRKFSWGIWICSQIPVSFLAGGIPNLQFNAGALLGGNYFGGVLDSNCGVPTLNELVFGVFKEDIGFAYSCGPDEDQFEHEVELFFLVHYCWR